ncbi:hypothetical protein [Mesorhizobium sp.]|uniref:hypothetical protein n=1 Tax=Mesorhizobium sp. TaxID=1871066 RepID=UPI0012184E45|nr:hypothetical protein [Mesorhizobium sp.]TIL30046.1 MAG: hypothetical protein E5Y85_25815 [Mesorhizobium sp.]
MSSRTKAAINDAFGEQMAALRTSAKAYDEGSKWEAKRLAACVYILVQDKGRAVSMFTQMGMKEHLEFVSSAGPLKPGNFAPEFPLAVLVPSQSSAEYVPRCTWYSIMECRAFPFELWWEQPILQANNEILTRKTLVLSLRDQDGGAHFDSSLDPIYRGFATEHKGGFFIVHADDGRREDMPLGPHFASMRQIAWEIEATLTRATQAE